MLILKYDRCRISTGDLVVPTADLEHHGQILGFYCVYIRLTVVCTVTYMTIFKCSVLLALEKKYDPYVVLVRDQVRRETKWYPQPKQTQEILIFISSDNGLYDHDSRRCSGSQTIIHASARRGRVDINHNLQPLC